MKFCFNWYGDNNDECLKVADEINIDLSKVKDLNDIKEFCEIHKNQRINLCINDFEAGVNDKLFETALSIQQELDIYNIIVRFPHYNKLIKDLLDKYNNPKFFFNTHINMWDMLYGYVNLGVTDIYIVEGLGFELEEIKKFLDKYENKPQIRVFPNVAQSSFDNIDGLRKFWIRPEDTKYYEDYIDIYEFFGENSKQKIYYDIYFKDKQWFGSLKEIIQGLDTDIDSKTIVPRFGVNRINCRQRCLKGRSCNMCKTIEILAQHFKEVGLNIIEDTEGKEEE